MSRKTALTFTLIGIAFTLTPMVFSELTSTTLGLWTTPGLLIFLIALTGLTLLGIGAGHWVQQAVPDFVGPIRWAMRMTGVLIILLGLLPVLILLQEDQGSYILEWDLGQWSWTILLSAPGLLFFLTPFFWPRAEEESG